MQIQKRDGRLVPFDRYFIKEALRKCFNSIGRTPTISIDELTSEIVKDVAVGTPTVEAIQDIVQVVLMKNKEFEAATHYIEYRQKHKEERQQRSVPEDVKAAFDLSKQYFSDVKQEFQFYDKYSRFDYTLGRRETWPETVSRTMEFLRKLSNNKLSSKDYAELTQAILSREVMPSMRLLATAGVAAERNNMSIYNCSYVPIDSLQSFPEILLLSMSGVGCGYSVEEIYVSELPAIKHQTDHVINHTVEDTTEGWVEITKLLLISLFEGSDVNVDYSLLRPAGAVLKTKGGRASGPGPLRNMVNFIRKLVKSRQGSRLSTLDAHDIVCKLADAAVCGGVRRSALICLFSYDDQKMRSCKSMDLVASNNTQRWNANNSAVWPDRSLSQLEIMEFMFEMFKSNNGEPGIFSRANAIHTKSIRRKDAVFGVNPCLTGDTLVETNTGLQSISSLVGTKFLACVLGKRYYSNDSGFTSSGVQPVFTITLENGMSVKATSNHMFRVINDVCNEWTQVSSLIVGNRLRLATEQMTTSPIASIVASGSEEVFDCTIPDIHVFSANGILTHNCGEIFLRPHGFCNLTSAILRNTDQPEDLLKKVKLATILGTIQSMATNFKGLRKIWKMNAEEERLLGVDLNGQADYGHDRLTAGLLKQAKIMAISTNRRYAEKLGINHSVAITCVKPSGNSSEFLGCSSGLHARWSPYYIRRMRLAVTNPLFRVLKDAGVTLDPENGQIAETATTWVASFPAKSPAGCITRKGETLMEDGTIREGRWTALNQLEVWAKNKLNYTEHNPSVTIYYTEDEVLDISKWLYQNQKILGGLSFLPVADSNYNLLPYEEITEEEYNKMMERFPAIDFSKIYRYEQSDYSNAANTVACEGDRCVRV